METILFWIAFSCGTISTGESTALLIGMRDGSGPVPWMTTQNIAWAVSDIALGVGLCLSACMKEKTYAISLAISGVLVATNLYRSIEYFISDEQPFCANTGLFSMALVKTGLAAAGLILSGILIKSN